MSVHPDRVVRAGAGALGRWASAVALAIAAVCAPPGVVAQAADRAVPVADDWEAQSVRELVRRDLRAALGRPADGAHGGPGAAAMAPLDEEGPDHPRLVALYGVGPQLVAEVQFGARTRRYMRGQPWPLDSADDAPAQAHRLLAMEGGCVRLEHAQRRIELCLPGPLSLGVP